MSDIVQFDIFAVQARKEREQAECAYCGCVGKHEPLCPSNVQVETNRRDVSDLSQNGYSGRRPRKTRSTDEAMSVLKDRRSDLVAAARKVALDICGLDGVTTRDVRSEMDTLGLLDPAAGEFWLGAVFNRNPEFVWRGEYRSYSDPGRNVHERTVKVWHRRGA